MEHAGMTGRWNTWKDDGMMMYFGMTVSASPRHAVHDFPKKVLTGPNRQDILCHRNGNGAYEIERENQAIDATGG